MLCFHFFHTGDHIIRYIDREITAVLRSFQCYMKTFRRLHRTLRTHTQFHFTAMTGNHCLVIFGRRITIFVRYQRLGMDTDQFTQCYQLFDYLFILIPMRPEHTRHSRHHQNIGIRLQNLILHSRVIQIHIIADKLMAFGIIIIATLKCIMVVNESHGISGHSLSAKRTGTLQITVRTAESFVEFRFLREIKGQGVVARAANVISRSFDITPILRNGEIRLCGLVVHFQILIAVSHGHIVAETIVFHRIQNPLRICFRPLLHILVCVIQIATSVKITTGIGCTTLRVRRIITRRLRFFKCLVRIAYMLLRKLEFTEVSEIIRKESTPGLRSTAVINHNIRQHFRTAAMQGCNQFIQIGFASPIAILVTILLS